MIPILLPPVTEDEVKENQLSHVVRPVSILQSL
jgi:hypothetical protein